MLWSLCKNWNALHFLNDFLTISDVILELFHESSVAQFTFHTYVIIYAHFNGLHFGSWPSDNVGDNFCGVYFEEGAVGYSTWCFVNNLQKFFFAIFLNVIPVCIKIMGITSYFHFDFCNSRGIVTLTPLCVSSSTPCSSLMYGFIASYLYFSANAKLYHLLVYIYIYIYILYIYI